MTGFELTRSRLGVLRLGPSCCFLGPGPRVSWVHLFALLVIPTILLPRVGRAQEPLVGVVADRETAAPLAGVYVSLEDRATNEIVQAVLTDGSGRFALLAEEGAVYRLHAERVGLATEATEWFSFRAGTTHRISLSERAVALEGLRVTAEVRTCGLAQTEAIVINRWWREVRKALRATALVESSEMAGLRFERFEREWTPNLRGLLHERILPPDRTASKPFVSQDPRTLSERGFVQGDEAERWFLAPDAAVLFSEPFLADHCFAIADVEGDDTDELRISVEPARPRPPDIRGVLTVDTISGELRSFDFEYANLPHDVPDNKAGGHLTFEYLPSGAWIVSDWWIRIPRIGQERGWRGLGGAYRIGGYVDRGGRAVEVQGLSRSADGRGEGGTLHGVVYDSLSGGGLVGARVSLVGSRVATRTTEGGRFTLSGIPSGRHELTFHHAELTELGLPSPVTTVDVLAGASDSITLATPGLATVGTLICSDPGRPPAVVLTGRIVSAAHEPPYSVSEIRATWIDSGERPGEMRSMWTEASSGSDGRYVLCDLPANVPISLAVRTDSAVWRDAGTAQLPSGRIMTMELRPGDEASAVVRGNVRVAGGAPLPGVAVSVVSLAGDTVAVTSSDAIGAFRMDAPAGVGYRVVANGRGYSEEASSVITLSAAESLDVDFELAPAMTGLAMRIEGFLVEVEARDRVVARRFLDLYGQNPTTLGPRWMDRRALDALAMAGDPGVAIQQQGIPGLWVQEGLKWGRDPRLCVTQGRGKPGGGSFRCAIVVLDGARIDLGTALLIDFRDLQAIAVLDPIEATTFYGTEAGGGAVLLWTRGGGS